MVTEKSEILLCSLFFSTGLLMCVLDVGYVCYTETEILRRCIYMAMGQCAFCEFCWCFSQLFYIP